MKASKNRILKKPEKFKTIEEKLKECEDGLTFTQKMQGFVNGLIMDKRATEDCK